MTKEKLEARAAIKSRKPTFTRRQGIVQFAKLKKSGWRAPKGMGNKQRRGRKGQPIKPSCGFGSPKEVKGLNKDGLLEVLINNKSDLEKIDSKTQIVVVSANVGGKKKLEILNLAKTKKISISNVKDIDKAIANLKKGDKKKLESKKVDKKEEKKTPVSNRLKTGDKKEEKKSKKQEAKK